MLYGSVNHEFESIDLSDEISKGKSIKQAIRNGIASHVQTVGKGGLLVTLAKISAHYDLGMQAQLDVTNAQLFSETQGRYIVIVKEGQTLDIDQAQEIGQLTHQQSFDISNSDVKIKENVSDIKQKWEGAIVQCLTTQD